MSDRLLGIDTGYICTMCEDNSIKKQTAHIEVDESILIICKDCLKSILKQIEAIKNIQESIRRD